MRCVASLLLVVCLSSPGWAQDEADDPPDAPDPSDADSKSADEERTKPLVYVGKGFGIDPVFLSFGGHVFIADPPNQDPENPTESTEIDPFPNGRLGGDVQLAGIDLVWYFAEGKMRLGGNLGVGTTTLGETGTLIGTVGGFVQFHDYFRIDGGFAAARSGNPALNEGDRDRHAWFAGVSFPTNLGTDALKALFRF